MSWYYHTYHYGLVMINSKKWWYGAINVSCWIKCLVILCFFFGLNTACCFKLHPSYFVHYKSIPNVHQHSILFFLILFLFAQVQLHCAIFSLPCHMFIFLHHFIYLVLVDGLSFICFQHSENVIVNYILW